MSPPVEMHNQALQQLRHLRKRSRAPSSVPGSLGSSSRKPAAGVGPSGSKSDSGRRVSRARKSLNFDAQPGPSRPRFTPPFDEAASFQHDVVDHSKDLSFPDPDRDKFWRRSPPPPPNPISSSSLPLLGFSITSKNTAQKRRSPRLNFKRKPVPPPKETKPTVCILSDDSGFEPTPPSSQNTSGIDLKPPSSTVSNADSVSVASSDYGTSSENSFGTALHSRLTRSTARDAFHSSEQNYITPLSPGYVSDIDEPLPLPSLDDSISLATSARTNTRETESQESDVTLVMTEEQEADSLEQTLTEDLGADDRRNYLDISNLSGAEDPGVKWVHKDGVDIIIPLQGFQLPPDYDPPSNTPSNTLRHFPSSQVTSRRLRSLNTVPVPTSPFYVSIKDEALSLKEAFLRCGLRLIGASHTITPQPVGTKFCSLYPAIISIPLTELPSAGHEVYCLYAEGQEHFDPNQDPGVKWSVMENGTMDIVAGRFTFETYEFCSYVIVIRDQGIETRKQIRARSGGKLFVPEMPGIEIQFPRGSLSEHITAKANVFLDTELNVDEFLKAKKLCPYFQNAIERRRAFDRPLASPIVMLEPHGFNFLPDSVRVDLPIPNYDEIVSRFGPSARLLVYQSCTGQSEESAWQVLNVELNLRCVKSGNQVQTIASFTVAHFSFFKIVWDLLSESLYEAKVGMSYFHSFVSFSMKCQANMEEAEALGEEGCRFGLEVICFRSDKRLPEHTNYKHKVGASMKPKLVRPGKIVVRLKSSYFDADDKAGEEPGLIKEEADFRGRDFEFQYCCKFKKDTAIDRGPFGKVIVNRQKDGKSGEKLFEFNLQKSGYEGEKTPGRDEDRWSIVALQELASGLFILDGDNWKLFATQIGFTKQEIKTQLKRAENPFTSMISAYQHRGGTPDEFVQALYAVNRELKINGGVSPTLSHQSRSSTGSSGRGSMNNIGKYSGSGGVGSFGSDSDTSGTQISQDSGVRVAGQGKKRSNPSAIRTGNSSKAKRPRLRPPAAGDEGDEESSDSLKASASEIDEGTGHEEPYPSTSTRAQNCIKDSSKSVTASSINRRNDNTKLETSFLWAVSGHLEPTTMNFRTLGRTLWLEESVLINIDAAHRQTGVRELYYQVLLAWREKFPRRCNFGTLYTALRDEGINAAAKAMMSIQRND